MPVVARIFQRKISEIPRPPDFFFGHHLDENLSWVYLVWFPESGPPSGSGNLTRVYHAVHVHKKLVTANFALSRSKNCLPQTILQQIYRSLFESHWHFGSIVWASPKPRLLHKLGVQQKKAIMIGQGLKTKHQQQFL